MHDAGATCSRRRRCCCRHRHCLRHFCARGRRRRRSCEVRAQRHRRMPCATGCSTPRSLISRNFRTVGVVIARRGRRRLRLCYREGHQHEGHQHDVHLWQARVCGDVHVRYPRARRGAAPGSRCASCCCAATRGACGRRSAPFRRPGGRARAPCTPRCAARTVLERSAQRGPRAAQLLEGWRGETGTRAQIRPHPTSHHVLASDPRRTRLHRCSSTCGSSTIQQ